MAFFQRNRMNNPKICMEPRNTPKEPKASWGKDAFFFLINLLLFLVRKGLYAIEQKRKFIYLLSGITNSHLHQNNKQSGHRKKMQRFKDICFSWTWVAEAGLFSCSWQCLCNRMLGVLGTWCKGLQELLELFHLFSSGTMLSVPRR